MTTPNTSANGGQILTDERILDLSDCYGVTFKADGGRESPYVEGFDTTENVLAFARAIEADLRASLAAPAPVSGMPDLASLRVFDTSQGRLVRFADVERLLNPTGETK